MKCPHCGYQRSRVLDSRPVHEGTTTRRRRECEECESRFTTFEMIEEVPLVVIKKDGSREEFSRKKLLRGLLRACEKRPVPLEQLEHLVSQVESILRETGNEIDSPKIGELVLEKMIAVDEVAYVRFASVYREYGDIRIFLQELNQLSERLSKQE